MEPQEGLGICRFFGSRNGCRHGTSCLYLHTLDSPLSLPPEKQICHFFRSGHCRKGSRCRFLHVNSEDPVGQGGLDDSHNDLVSRPESNKCQADEDNDTHKNNSSEEEVCGICLESKIETYGLLTGCDHLFCIACISAWRNEANPISDTRSEVQAKRGCPTCRQHSNFVVPSRHFVTGQEKTQLIREKLEIKKKIPCRDWTKDKRCKFGSHCHYAHLDENGQDCKPRQREREKAEHRESQGMRFETMEEILGALSSVFMGGVYDDDEDEDEYGNSFSRIYHGYAASDDSGDPYEDDPYEHHHQDQDDPIIYGPRIDFDFDENGEPLFQEAAGINEDEDQTPYYLEEEDEYGGEDPYHEEVVDGYGSDERDDDLAAEFEEDEDEIDPSYVTPYAPQFAENCGEWSEEGEVHYQSDGDGCGSQGMYEVYGGWECEEGGGYGGYDDADGGGGGGGWDDDDGYGYGDY